MERGTSIIDFRLHQRANGKPAFEDRAVPPTSLFAYLAPISPQNRVELARSGQFRPPRNAGMHRPSSSDHFFLFFRKTYCIAVSNDDVKVWPIALPFPKSQRCRQINDIGPALGASRPSSPQETPSGRVPYGYENHYSYETRRLHKNGRRD